MKRREPSGSAAGPRRGANKRSAGVATGTASTGGEYLAQSERPLASLLFLLPLVLFHLAYATGWAGGRRTAVLPPGQGPIIAFSLLEEFFGMVGATGVYLPAAALVGMLVTAHLFRRDPWRVRPRTFVAMMMESIGWAIPLLAAGFLVARFLPLGQFSAMHGNVGAVVAQCVAAGVYEEMVFRLIGVTTLSLIFRDLFRIPRGGSAIIIVLLSGVLFSAYHYLNPAEVFRWRTFLFRAAAGAYFTVLYGVRGFGVTAGAHAAYDLVVVTMIVD